MIKIFLPIFLLFAGFILIGCDSPIESQANFSENQSETQTQTKFAKYSQSWGFNGKNCNNKCGGYNCGTTSHVCGQTFTLWAGQSINVGNVTLSQDQNNLYVTYTVTSGWVITETHLDVSTQQYTQRGSPGQYDYKTTHGNGVTTYTYSIPLTWSAGTKLYFLAHAVVKKNSYGRCVSTETAYAGTIVKPKGGSWYGTFCYTIVSSTQQTYSISGVAFVDANSNGILDGGETPLPGVTVTLSGGSTITTNANGEYSFANLAAGNYTVTASSVTGYNFTTPSSATITISTANVDMNFGYALIPTPTYSVTGIAFFDTDGNGFMDAGETGIAGIQIVISNGSVSLVAQTDANGVYSISGLLADTYTVTAYTPEGLNGTTLTDVKLTVNTNKTVNFGFNDAPVPLSSKKLISGLRYSTH